MPVTVGTATREPLDGGEAPSCTVAAGVDMPTMSVTTTNNTAATPTTTGEKEGGDNSQLRKETSLSPVVVFPSIDDLKALGDGLLARPPAEAILDFLQAALPPPPPGKRL